MQNIFKLKNEFLCWQTNYFVFVYNFQLILFTVLVCTKFEHMAGFLLYFCKQANIDLIIKTR